MKTLLESNPFIGILRLLYIGGICFTFSNHIAAQCAISGPESILKCAGQSYNLATGITVSGTTGAIQYSWDGGPFTSSPNMSVAPQQTTTYILQITDEDGCTASHSLTINVIPLPVVDAGPDVSICQGESVTLCGTATSSNGAITVYNWISVGVGQCRTVSPTTQTTYIFYALDEAGCAATNELTVFVNSLPSVNAGDDVMICLTEGTHQLTGIPAGGTWSGTDVSGSGVFTPTSTGTFNCTYSYSDVNNCQNTDVVTVTVIEPSSIDGGPDMELCLNSPAVQLPSVGSWSGSASVTPAGLFTPNAVGTHLLEVTSNAGNCSATDQVIIEVLPLPVINTGGLISVCEEQCAQLNVSASSSNGVIQQYQWSGGPVTNPAIANPTACPITNTTYSVEVTDAKGCKVSNIVTVNVLALPEVDAGGDLTICANSGPVQLTGESPTGGTWSGAGVSGSGLFTPTTPGDYQLTYLYTSSTNCTNTATRTIHVIDPAGVDAGDDFEICLHASPVQLTGNGSWSGSPLVTSGGLFTPNSVGSHQVVYTENIGECQSTDLLNIYVLPLPVVNAGNDQSVCEGDVVNISGAASSANGSIDVLWWNQPFVNNANAATTSFVASNTVTLQLTATDNKGCSASDEITIQVYEAGVVDAGDDITVCSNEGAVALIGQTPAGGTWSGTGVTSEGVFTPSNSGSYTLSYTYVNPNGCVGVDTRTVHVNAPSTINVGDDLEVCLGTAPIQLLSNGVWNGTSWVSPEGEFTPGAIGTYLLTYSEQIGGCTSTANKTITVLPLPEIELTANTEVCEGELVHITGTASSANGNIQELNWLGHPLIQLNGTMDVSIVAQNTVTISVTATDFKGCEATEGIEIMVHPLPMVNAGNDLTVCQNEETVILSGASPAGGSWQGDGVTDAGVFTIGSETSYTLFYSYTDAAGCIATDSLTIQVQIPQTPDAGPDVTLCHNSTPYQLPTGGSWSGSTWVTNEGLFTPGAVGVFNLVYTESQGNCEATDTVVVTVWANPQVDAGDTLMICEGNSIQLQAMSSGGSGGFLYLWSHPELLNHPNFNNPILTTTETVTLTVTVTDSHQCTAQDDVTVVVVPLAIPTMAIHEPHCVNSPIQITNESLHAANYQWEFGNGTTSILENPTVTYTAIGNYVITLQATNAAGCTETITQAIDVIAPPVAQFSVDVNSGCTPLTVAINNESSGQDVQYQWDFGNGSSSDAHPVDIVYTAIGTTANYTILLTTSNVCGSTTDTQSITVYPMPNADFDAHLSTQCSPVTTQFTNSSTGNATSYLWDFGDGETSNSPVPAPKIYTTDETASTYLIKLHAINQCGEDVEQLSIVVMPNTIQPLVTPSVLNGCSPLLVEFANTTTGATVHEFVFGDGQSSQLYSPSHIFEHPGDYEVTYYANDGCSFDTLTMNIHVDETPTIQITANNTSICPNEEVHFASQTTGDLMDIVWNLGGGVVSMGAEASKLFATAGNETISATAIGNNGCEAEASVDITIHQQPIAAFTLPNDAQCSPWSLCLENHSQQATMYSWTMDGIALSTLAEPCHTFSNMTDTLQEIFLELRAENEFGCWDTTSRIITIYPAPDVHMTLEANTYCQRDTLQASANASNDSYLYKWYINASQVATVPNPNLVFMTPGNHLVKMVASNNYGCSVMDTMTVLVHPKPVIDIMPSVFEGCPPLRVSFVNHSDYAVEYLWSFSNGQTSTLKQPTTVFTNSGQQVVNIEATSEHGCVTRVQYADLIEVFPLPKPSFDVEPDTEHGIFFNTTVPFTNTSQGATSYLWDFGDGGTSDVRHPTHHYRGGGDFLVTLTATNQHGCKNSYDQLIKIDNTVYVYVPNAFTPDNDGINDVFQPVLSSFDEIYKYHFIVTNKWGDKVFETADPTEAWLGNVLGGDYYAPSDLYNWQLSIIYNHGQSRRQYKGEIMLLR